ncbi:hypothetical protein AJ79_09208 [Helicocarpus griseus UAMH5409]|uniref:Alcohol dehydrogenase-like N-terminal domain-containing protein n=1 Tax=Helicocarpus griseus UAMH5409 TaxID=1447875 RepID=A0A2B7WLC4_9EURO|nr:hypothetical protein AJ79_09208 [Helicocarpus griseus UAMH5409]
MPPLSPSRAVPCLWASGVTPEPSPNNVLIEVEAVALNPCDYYQQGYGIPPVLIYPAVIGCDAAQMVVK